MDMGSKKWAGGGGVVLIFLVKKVLFESEFEFKNWTWHVYMDLKSAKNKIWQNYMDLELAKNST